MSISVIETRKSPSFYVVQVTAENGKQYLCWMDKKRFYFAEHKRGYKKPLPPTLFTSRKEAQEALDNIPKKNGNLSQFSQVLECKKVKIVKVFLEL